MVADLLKLCMYDLDRAYYSLPFLPPPCYHGLAVAEH